MEVLAGTAASQAVISEGATGATCVTDLDERALNLGRDRARRRPPRMGIAPIDGIRFRKAERPRLSSIKRGLTDDQASRVHIEAPSHAIAFGAGSE